MLDLRCRIRRFHLRIFGTTAPAGSITVPLIAPRNVCEFSGVTANNTIRAKTLSRQVIFFLREFLSGWAAGALFKCNYPRQMCVGTQIPAVFTAMLRLSAGATLDLPTTIHATASQLYICDTAKSP